MYKCTYMVWFTHTLFSERCVLSLSGVNTKAVTNDLKPLQCRWRIWILCRSFYSYWPDLWSLSSGSFLLKESTHRLKPMIRIFHWVSTKTSWVCAASHNHKGFMIWKLSYCQPKKNQRPKKNGMVWSHWHHTSIQTHQLYTQYWAFVVIQHWYLSSFHFTHLDWAKSISFSKLLWLLFFIFGGGSPGLIFHLNNPTFVFNVLCRTLLSSDMVHGSHHSYFSNK